VSKNVAVFVDVANIFYAAKAAGVDIDYVTLLKSATAGRDFVRAYAYTGLDPENENQRKFHDFLTRSGYKVVSKDIRKYGDGRIKANLDIELVVDLMRMAEKIDIAVVISGDGDFAPAIRAVQQLGVRVEVISFRGNTSSDLIEVADVFTDIAHIARVEKGARSGRRVASEDDLSMTAVPEKETDLGPRRRRGRRGEREERPERPVVGPTAAGGLVVLPGERLSRVAEEGEEPEEELPTGVGGVPALAEAEGEAVPRRRRRRRGGRGRGRGRGEGEQVLGEVAADEEELLEEELAPLPQHSTFGSVWDSQIGLPAAPVVASGGLDEDLEEEEEPEIPEYLLAERRQQGRGRGRDRRRGAPGGYRTAVDRERYGRGGGVYGGRAPDRQRGAAQAPRQPAPPRVQHQPMPAPPRREVERGEAPSAEPWSEVPPEVQELLRAELARRAVPGQPPAPPAGRAAGPRARAGGGPHEAAAPPAAEAPAAEAPKRTRARKAAPAEGTATTEAAAAAPAPRTRRRTTKATVEPGEG
jgi:uncharacterized LabA/DUF88 family protein